MGCTRSKLMEIPWCEPITSFGWSGSLSSCLVGKRTYPWYCLLTYIRANSVWWETEQENDRYHFTPKRWTKYRPRFWTIKRYMNLYTNLRSADTPKKLRSFEKRASPLSPGTRQCVHLVPKNWDTDACDLRHRLVRFCFFWGGGLARFEVGLGLGSFFGVSWSSYLQSYFESYPIPT